MQMLQRIFLSAILLLLTFHMNAQSRLPESIGPFRSYKKTTAGGFLISAANAQLELTPYGPDVIRVRATRQAFEPADASYAVIARPQGALEVEEKPDRLLFRTTALTVEVTKSPVRVRFLLADGRVLNEDEAGLGVTWNGSDVTCHKKLFADERFVGLGEKTGGLDRRGSAYENWNTDNPWYPVSADPLYVSTPFYIGIHSGVTYGIFFDNSFKSTFNFGASNERFSSFGAVDGEMDYYFFGRQTVGGILESYTSITGRMTMPPLWSLGYQQCRWSYTPESEVMSVAQNFRDRKIPADVIYLDIDYMDAYKIFTWHPTAFPKPQQMIKKLRDMGFHVVVIVDPGIKVEKGYRQYEEGLRDDHFVRYPDGSLYQGQVWPGWCHFPDFTKAGTRRWWGSAFGGYVSDGIEGFWNDMNEPATWGQRFPDVVTFDFDGRKGTHKEAHNLYGFQMARSTYEGTRNLMGKRPFVLTRAAFSGIQRYSAVWTGDNVASDEHMLLGVRLVNSMGLAGISFAGPDVGGFGGTPSKELYGRWMSIGAFTPFYRGHTMKDTPDQEPWAFGEDIEALCRHYLKQRYRLLPYLYASFYESTRTGLPVSRSLAIFHPHDHRIYEGDFQHQYYFGPNIMVAPVSSTQQFAKVYFPAGTGGWYRLDSDAFFAAGTTANVDARLWELPVFVKAGSIVVTQSDIEYTDQKPSDILDVHVYANGQAPAFQYYEDDGESYGYEQGQYYRRQIQAEVGNQRGKVTFGAVEGSFGSKFGRYRLILHGFEQVQGLRIGDRQVSVSRQSNTFVSEPLPAAKESFVAEIF